MSLLIKALNKAEEAQAQNAKAERAQAQYSIADAQTQHAKAEDSAERVKFERTSAKNKPSIAIENASDMVLSLAPATHQLGLIHLLFLLRAQEKAPYHLRFLWQ